MCKYCSITRNLMAVVAAVVISVAITGCAKQEAKQHSKDSESYAEMIEKVRYLVKKDSLSAFAFIDSVEQTGDYPAEVIDIARGTIYANVGQIKKNEECFYKAINDNLYKVWPNGYYETVYKLAYSLYSRNNLEQAIRLASAAYNRIQNEADPECDKHKWIIMALIGAANLRLHNFDESDRILDKAYEGQRNYTIKHNDLKSAG